MELGALVAFIADTGAQNALPATIDPQQPIPADVVLDFDTRSDFAQLEVDDLVQDTWIRNPIVIFSKVCFCYQDWLAWCLEHSFARVSIFQVYSPQGREVKKLFASYKLKPAPTIFDIDERGMFVLISLTYY
jgi:hypothetical protein